MLMALVVQPTLLERIKKVQFVDLTLQKMRRDIESGHSGDFNVDAEGVIRF